MNLGSIVLVPFFIAVQCFYTLVMSSKMYLSAAVSLSIFRELHVLCESKHQDGFTVNVYIRQIYRPL